MSITWTRRRLIVRENIRKISTHFSPFRGTLSLELLSLLLNGFVSHPSSNFLHWLKIRQRIDYKVTLSLLKLFKLPDPFTFETTTSHLLANRRSSAYLTLLVHPAHQDSKPVTALSVTLLLSYGTTCLFLSVSYLGHHLACPPFLSHHVLQSPTLPFYSKLKSYLFHICYPP